MPHKEAADILSLQMQDNARVAREKAAAEAAAAKNRGANGQWSRTPNRNRPQIR